MKSLSTSINNYSQTLKKKRGPLRSHTRVSVIGLGYVGMPLARIVARHGYQVVGFDIDKKRIDTLRKAEKIITTDKRNSADQKISFTNSKDHLDETNIYIICVPTPVNEDRTPDLSPLRKASETVGHKLQRGSLVLVESTVNPGVSSETVIPILEHASRLKAGKDFDYAHCPERINPGDNVYTTANIPRVLGATTKEGLSRSLAFYRSILDAPIKTMGSVEEAEATKMLENAFRDINIAFVNEVAMAFEREGIDIVNVINGAATKPFGFMAHYPGCGVGGHCIPVDPHYLIEYGKQHGFDHRFLKTARKINDHMPFHAVERLKEAMDAQDRDLPSTTVALLGLSYKKNIEDTRESPALTIKAELERLGIPLVTYDPYVPELSSVTSLDQALEAASAVIIATDHDQFCTLRPSDFLQFGTMIVIDGRNCLPKEEFMASALTYRGIGR